MKLEIPEMKRHQQLGAFRAEQTLLWYVAVSELLEALDSAAARGAHVVYQCPTRDRCSGGPGVQIAPGCALADFWALDAKVVSNEVGTFRV